MSDMGRAAAAAWLGVFASLLFGAPAFAAGPKPDPPPIKHAPPPPPAPQPAPAAPQPAPPPPPVVVTPVAPVAPVAQPTAAEKRAKARRAARRKAAARAKSRRRVAEGSVIVREQLPALASGASGTGSSGAALPLLLIAFTAAIVMLGLALTPTRAVPWSRASHALEDHRDELGVIGALSLVATMVFFVLVQVTK